MNCMRAELKKKKKKGGGGAGDGEMTHWLRALTVFSAITCNSQQLHDRSQLSVIPIPGDTTITFWPTQSPGPGVI